MSDITIYNTVRSNEYAEERYLAYAVLAYRLTGRRFDRVILTPERTVTHKKASKIR